MEVQNHGVIFEDTIIQSITGISKSEYQKLIPGSYTSAMDISKDTLSDTDYSIKVSKGGKSIGCGDILRFLSHVKNQEFIMIVGVWNQISSNTKRYSEILEFHFTPEDYNMVFGSICEESLKGFVDYVKSIPSGKESQINNRKIWKEKRNTITENTNSLISIDAKIDSKSQRRVQCSLKVSDLISVGIKHKRYSIEYKGITLPIEQTSSARVFTRGS